MDRLLWVDIEMGCLYAQDTRRVSQQQTTFFCKGKYVHISAKKRKWKRWIKHKMIWEKYTVESCSRNVFFFPFFPHLISTSSLCRHHSASFPNLYFPFSPHHKNVYFLSDKWNARLWEFGNFTAPQLRFSALWRVENALERQSSSTEGCWRRWRNIIYFISSPKILSERESERKTWRRQW